MGQIQRAAKVRGPFGDGTNATSVRLYTVSATSRADSVPASWAGRYVSIYASGGAVQYYFSTNSSAACDETLAASNDGATSTPAQLGGIVPDGQFVHVQIPDRKPNETMYFVRASTATCSARIELKDDPDEVL